MEVNEDEDAPKSVLKERLKNYREPVRQPFIYRAQNYYLRDSNDNAHEPKVVAIGPYHHGKQSLKMMEEHKLRFLRSLLLRKNESVRRYLSALEEIEEEARSCYAEKLSFSESEFIEMLVLDGCFIIQLLRTFQRRSGNFDPIFQMFWFKVNVIHDLILFENQIPFFVLSKLSDLVYEGEPNQQQLFIESIFKFLGLSRRRGTNVRAEEIMHLLHLKHAINRPLSPIYFNLNLCPRQRKFQWIPSATELKDANVTFKSQGTSSIPYELTFNNGVLTMSDLTIHDGTDALLRNLILYEQYFPDDLPTYVTDYVRLLDCLVNTGRDVEILSQGGILKNVTGHNQMAADIINRLAHSAMVSQTNFIYANTFREINAHHERPWHRARAALNRDYFNTPWAYISFVAALILLLLTVAQTVFSAIQL